MEDVKFTRTRSISRGMHFVHIFVHAILIVDPGLVSKLFFLLGSCHRLLAFIRYISM
jgi:hypothetical protein